HPGAALARERRSEILAVDVLHREEHVVADATEVEDRDDVLLDQGHRQLGLADEQLEEPRVAAAVLAQALDHQPLLDARDAAAGEVDLGHAAARQRSQELVATERRHRGQYTGPRPTGPVSGIWAV